MSNLKEELDRGNLKQEFAQAIADFALENSELIGVLVDFVTEHPEAETDTEFLQVLDKIRDIGKPEWCFYHQDCSERCIEESTLMVGPFSSFEECKEAATEYMKGQYTYSDGSVDSYLDDWQWNGRCYYDIEDMSQLIVCQQLAKPREL